MKLSLWGEAELAAYVSRQLHHLFPDGHTAHAHALVQRHLKAALGRLQHCINAIKVWPQDQFDHLHSSQYTTFLYFLAHTVWQAEADRDVCNKLFGLNKALNGIDLFYEVDLPPVFFIGHSVGIVLAKATYGNRLVLYQGCTVGKNHGVAPVLGDDVVLYPQSTVIGRCHIGAGSVLAQGVRVVNQNTPGQSLVFAGEGATLCFKPTLRDTHADFFR